jgi:hypothetical protein
MASTSISHDQIAERAFQFYCARGEMPGHDLDDWLQAERELRKPESPKRSENFTAQTSSSYQMKPRRQAQSSIS